MEDQSARPLPRPGLRDHLRLLRRITHDPQPVLDELRERYGPVCQIGAGPVRGAVVGSATAVGELLHRPVEEFRWGHKFNVLGFVVGDGSMIVSDGTDHRRRRGAVQPAFGRRRLEEWIPMIVERTDAAVARLDDGPADLYPFGRDLVFDVAVRAFFGAALAGHIPELAQRFETAQAYLESPAYRQIPHPFPFTARSRVRADRTAIDRILDDEIRRLRDAGSVTDEPADVLETLVRDGSLADDEIRDQVVTLIGAGYHTTAASLAWTLWRALLEPGLWSALRAETDHVLADRAPADLDAGSLAKLDLADRVVREALRLHPAGVVSPRESAVDLDIAGHIIPARTLVLWSPHLAGRDPEVWPDPLRFDPERWRTPAEEQRRAGDAAWVPFGRPPRNCIGFAFAHMELVLIVSRLAQRLDITTRDGHIPAPHGMVVNRPTGGLPVSLHRRRPDVGNES